MKLNKSFGKEVLKLKSKDVISDEESIIKELGKLLIKSVDKRVKGKAGIAFSGGVDSSLLALICDKLGKDFVLYSVGLKNSEDLRWAERVTKEYKWRWKSFLIGEKEAEEIIKKVVQTIPNKDVVNVGVGCVVYKVLEMCKNDKIKNVLGGLGSEELFAGYERHKGDIFENCWKGLENTYERDLKRDLALGKYFGIELLCPYLDKNVIEYSMKIDPELRIKGDIKKYILRRVALDIGLRKEFSFRPKKAAQYGSKFDSFLDKLARRKGFKYKKDYLITLE